MNAIASGKMDNVLLDLKKEIEARIASPDYKGKKPGPRKEPTVHCGGMFPHAPHYHQNINSRYNENQWCIGTV